MRNVGYGNAADGIVAVYLKTLASCQHMCLMRTDCVTINFDIVRNQCSWFHTSDQLLDANRCCEHYEKECRGKL